MHAYFSWKGIALTSMNDFADHQLATGHFSSRVSWFDHQGAAVVLEGEECQGLWVAVLQLQVFGQADASTTLRTSGVVNVKPQDRPSGKLYFVRVGQKLPVCTVQAATSCHAWLDWPEKYDTQKHPNKSQKVWCSWQTLLLTHLVGLRKRLLVSGRKLCHQLHRRLARCRTKHEESEIW